jgi:hypothetical protein
MLRAGFNNCWCAAYRHNQEKHFMSLRFKGFVVAVVALAGIGLQAAERANGPVINVVGQDNIAVDRANLQAAIDAAPDGATIHLRGVFQFDGTVVLVSRSHLTIAGVAHGGSQGPLLKGVLNVSGLPVGDLPVGPPPPNVAVHFNRGISIGPTDGGSVEDVTLRGFAMSGFNRAVAVQSFQAIDNLCDSVNAGVETRNVTIQDLEIDNVIRGIQSFGDVRDLTVKNSVVTGAIAQGILINGGGVGCFNPDGSPQPGGFDAGSTVGAEIRNNHFATADGAGALQTFDAVGPNADILVMGNTFDGGAAAVHLNGHVSNFVVRNNLIKNGGSQGSPTSRIGGIRMTNGSGYEVRNNTYQNNMASLFIGSVTYVPRDVWLFELATGNTVTEGKGTIVLDLGTGNTITIKGS